MNAATLTHTAAEEVLSPGFFGSIWNYIWGLITGLWEGLPVLLVNLLLCVGVWCLAKLLVNLIGKYTGKVLADDNKYTIRLSDAERSRKRSVATLLKSAARYVIYFIAIFIMLGILGITGIDTLLASAGIGSVAIGFGAQNLVKDVISGLFMVFENQYAVGDYVRINTGNGEVEGIVEAVAIRVTYLRDTGGRQYVIPNGTIVLVTNCSRGSDRAVVFVDIAYEEDIRHAQEVMLRAARECAAQLHDKVESEPVVQDVEAFAASGVTLRLSCEVKAANRGEVCRALRLAIKEAFDKEGIEIPYNKVVLVADQNKDSNI